MLLDQRQAWHSSLVLLQRSELTLVLCYGTKVRIDNRVLCYWTKVRTNTTVLRYWTKVRPDIRILCFWTKVRTNTRDLFYWIEVKATVTLEFVCLFVEPFRHVKQPSVCKNKTIKHPNTQHFMDRLPIQQVRFRRQCDFSS